MPQNNVLLKQKWLEAIPTNVRITDSSVVCSKHFKQQDFSMTSTKTKRLLDTSVPSIFDRFEARKNQDILKSV